MNHRNTWTTQDWLGGLDNVISIGQSWLQTLPPRIEDELRSINAAKQLADEVCQFASSISSALHLNHKVAAYANLRPLLDRLFHAALFFEDLTRTSDWAYWSMAEINRLLNNALSQGAVNPSDRDAMRDLLRDIRHWNRTGSGTDRQMLRPSKYKWHETLEAMSRDANPRLKGAYDITSTYVHPTYRGPNEDDPGERYVLEQALWITAATLIICGASLILDQGDNPSYRADPHLLELIEVTTQFLTGFRHLAGIMNNPPEGVTSAQILHIYAAMLFSFIYDREVIRGQPLIK